MVVGVERGVARRGGAAMGLAAILVLGVSPQLSARDCHFSDLRWSDDGRQLQFVAGSGHDVRSVVVDLETGDLIQRDPRAHDPVWSELNGRILFRDVFGVFEWVPDGFGNAQARQLVFLPEASRVFLRAFGEDARGQLLVWTFDRDRREHQLYRAGPEGLASLPGPWSGVDARRTWEERNRARAFAAVGGLFVRSRCVRRPHRQDRLCMENIARAGMQPSPFFRVTMGPPGGVQVVQNRCAPTAIAPLPDSAYVVFGLLEDVDEQGSSEVLSAWVANWDQAVRVYETLLPRAVPVVRRHPTWMLPRGRDAGVWVDAAGAIWNVDAGALRADPWLEPQELPARAPLYRVVAFETRDPAAAADAVAELRDAGMEAGLRRRGGAIEVQAGATPHEASARQQVDALRRLGFGDARSVPGDVEEVAAEMGFAWTPRPGGGGAYLRQVETAAGTYSEIWWRPERGAPRRLVPAFTRFEPRWTPRP